MSAQRLTHMKHTGQWQVFLCPLLRICKLVHPSSYLESYEYTQHIIQLNLQLSFSKNFLLSLYGHEIWKNSLMIRDNLEANIVFVWILCFLIFSPTGSLGVRESTDWVKMSRRDWVLVFSPHLGCNLCDYILNVNVFIFTGQ